MNLSDILSGLLTKNGITVYKLHKEINVAEPVVSRWKTGETSPNAENLVKIAEYFNVSIDYLMGVESELNCKRTKDIQGLSLAHQSQIDTMVQLLKAEELSDMENG